MSDSNHIDLSNLPGDVHVSFSQMESCKVCGKHEDLRMGACFHCADHVDGRPIKGGHGVPPRMAMLGAYASMIHFKRFEEYERLYPFPDCTCEVLLTWKESTDHARDCQQSIAERPNFTHKATGVEVRWYKYIGRDTEVNTPVTYGEWLTILESCLASIGGPLLEDAARAYSDAEAEEAEASKRAMSFWLEP